MTLFIIIYLYLCGLAIVHLTDESTEITPLGWVARVFYPFVVPAVILFDIIDRLTND